MKYRFVLIGILILFTFGAGAQSFDIKLGEPRKFSWEVLVRHPLYATQKADYYFSENNYGKDYEYFQEEPTFVIGNRDYNWTLYKVDRTTSKVEEGIPFSTRFRNEEGEEVTLHSVNFWKTNGETVDLIGVGKMNKTDFYVFSKTSSIEGQTLTDWKPMYKVFSAPAKESVYISFYKTPDNHFQLLFTEYKDFETLHPLWCGFSPDMKMVFEKKSKLSIKNNEKLVWLKDETDFRYYLKSDKKQNLLLFAQSNNNSPSGDKPALTINAEGKALGYVDFLEDSANGILFLTGGYENKKTTESQADGLFFIKVDYKNGKQLETRFTPFTGTIGKDNKGPMAPSRKNHQIGTIVPIKTDRYSDGTILLYFETLSAAGNPLCYFATRFGADGTALWTTYLAGYDCTNKETFGYLGKTAFEFKKDMLNVLVKTTSGDLTATNLKEADNGEDILMNVSVNKEGARKTSTVLAYGQRKDLRNLRPCYIKTIRDGEFGYRFRNTKETMLFGSIRRIDP